MQARTADRPADRAVTAVQALDLEPIRLRVMDVERGEGWTRERAESAERGYRSFLTLLARHPESMASIVVSKDVDEFWHTHILHTMKYTADCHGVFGTYLHHNPELEARSAADVEATRRLHRNLAAEAAGAMCSAAIAMEKPEMCSAAVQASAMCSAAVEANKPAMCSAAVEPDKPAMCSAAVHAQAMCSAAVEPRDPAMCSAAIQADSAAMCSAAVRAGPAT